MDGSLHRLAPIIAEREISTVRLWFSRTSEGKHGKSYASIRIVTQSLQCTGCGIGCHKRSVSKQEIHHPRFPAVGLSASLSAAVCGDTIARLRLSNSRSSRMRFFRAFFVRFWRGFLFHPRAGLGLSLRRPLSTRVTRSADKGGAATICQCLPERDHIV